MAHKITYYGDAQIAVDAVCKWFANDYADWFVQIEKHDGGKVEGHITGYEDGTVEITEMDEDTLAPKEGGKRWNVSTEDIYHLEVP